MEKIFNTIMTLIMAIANVRIKAKFGEEYRATKISDFNPKILVNSGVYVPAEFDDDSYKEKGELEELHAEFINSQVNNMSFEEKLSLVESVAKKEYQTRSGWYSSLAKYLPDAAPFEMSRCRYDEDTKTLHYSFESKSSEYIPESNDGYRRARVLDSSKWVSVERDITDPKFVEYAAKRIITARNPFDKWVEAAGFKIKESLFKSIRINADEVIQAAKDQGLNDVVQYLDKLYAEYVDENNKFIDNKIAKVEETKATLVEAYNAKKDLVKRFLAAKDAERVVVSKGRDGKPIVKGFGKIKFFDKSIKNAPTCGVVYILDKVELAKVEIIKDFIRSGELDDLRREMQIFITDKNYYLYEYDADIKSLNKDIEKLKTQYL